jgi:hypothetical protein
MHLCALDVDLASRKGNRIVFSMAGEIEQIDAGELKSRVRELRRFL